MKNRIKSPDLKNPDRFFHFTNQSSLFQKRILNHVFCNRTVKMALYKLIVPLLISLCLILPMTLASKFEYCGSKDYAVKVNGVKISPNPVKKGKPATFIISATTSETITGGKLRVDVRYFGFPVYGEYHNLCEETSCPVTGGDFVVSHSQELPGFTPSGSYSLTMKMIDGEGDELTCISFGFHIGSASSVTDI